MHHLAPWAKRTLTSRTLKMATRMRSWHFLYFSALTRQIRAAGLKTKALRFVVWDRNVPSSEISNFRFSNHDVRDVSHVQYCRTVTDRRCLSSLVAIVSLGPGSAMRERGKKRGPIGKISASEASPAVSWGGEKAATLSPSQTTSRLGSLADFFFAHADFFFLFPPMRSLVSGYCNAHVIGLPHSLLSLLTSRR